MTVSGTGTNKAVNSVSLSIVRVRGFSVSPSLHRANKYPALGVATMVAEGLAHVGCTVTLAVPIAASEERTHTWASITSIKLEKWFQREAYEAVLPQGIYTGVEAGMLSKALAPATGAIARLEVMLVSPVHPAKA